MKLYHSLLASLAILAAPEAHANPDTLRPIKIVVQPSDIFVPSGFDGNDNAQIVVAGVLPNTCFKAGKLSAVVDEKTKKIVLSQEALQYTGCWCAPIKVPYFQSVDLGVLNIGDFTVFAKGNSRPEKQKLIIAPAASTSPDDHFYAPIEEAALDVRGRNPILTLRGTFPSGCMRMQEIRVIHKSENVMEVLPITSLREGDTCAPGLVPFEASVELERRPGKTLIHIRALNGQAINKILEL